MQLTVKGSTFSWPAPQQSQGTASWLHQLREGLGAQESESIGFRGMERGEGENVAANHHLLRSLWPLWQ